MTESAALLDILCVADASDEQVNWSIVRDVPRPRSVFAPSSTPMSSYFAPLGALSAAVAIEDPVAAPSMTFSYSERGQCGSQSTRHC